MKPSDEVTMIYGLWYSGKWLVPPKPAEKKPLKQRIKDKLPHWMSMTFIMNNRYMCVRDGGRHSLPERRTVRETDIERQRETDRE